MTITVNHTTDDECKHAVQATGSYDTTALAQGKLGETCVEQQGGKTTFPMQQGTPTS
jgi:hypothetical protein